MRLVKRHAGGFLLVATALVAPGVAFAQARQADNAVQEVIVTARRVEESLQDVPIAITAITGESLRRSGVRELRDIVATVPNLSTQTRNGTPHGLFIGLRGQQAPDISLSVDTPVGLYADGINIPHAYGATAALVDLARVEVLRGPQGTLYGRNTTGGAISFISRDPHPGFGAQILAGAGNYGQTQGQAIVNMPLGADAGVRLVGDLKHRRGFGRDSQGRRLMGEDGLILRANFKAQVSDFMIRLVGGYQDFDNTGIIQHVTGLVPATATAPAGGRAVNEYTLALGLPITPANLAATSALMATMVGGPADFWNSFTARPQYSRFRGPHFSAQLDWKPGEDLTLRSITGYRKFRNDTSIDIDGFPVVIQETVTPTRARFLSQELQLLKSGERQDYVMGAYYSNEDGSESNLNLATPRLANNVITTNYGDLTSKSYAVFGQLNWLITERATLTLGARYTRENKRLITRNRNSSTCLVPLQLRPDPAACMATINAKFEKPTWLASLNYKWSEDVNVYAKVAQSFRGGGHNLRGTTVAALTPFHPETVTEYEAGLKSRFFGRSLQLNMAAFHQEYRDAQRSAIILINNATVNLITNAARARLDGFEAEAEWRATEALTFRGSIGYTDAKYVRFVDVNGDRSKEPWPTPDFTGSASIDYVSHLPIGDLSYNLGYRYRTRQNFASASRFADQVSQPALGLFDARMALSFNAGRTEVSAYARNLAKKKYYVGATGLESLGFNAMVPGEPRVMGLQIVQKFGAE